MIFKNILRSINNGVHKIFLNLVNLYGTKAELYRPNSSEVEGFFARSFKTSSTGETFTKVADINIIPLIYSDQAISDISADYYEMERVVYTDYSDIRVGDRLIFSIYGKTYDMRVSDTEQLIPLDTCSVYKITLKG